MTESMKVTADNGPDALSVTRGSEWRQRRVEGIIVELPSGAVARLRPVSLDDLVREGQVPDALTPIVISMFAGEKFNLDTWKNISGMYTFLDTVTRVAFMDPRVVDEPTAEDEVAIADVSYHDKLFILEWVQSETYRYEPFRGEHQEDVRPVSNDDNDKNEAV